MSLYPPPKERMTEVFTHVPEEFRLKDTPSGWVDANKPGQQVDSFLEGPSFDREGYLYVTDIPYGRVFKISPNGDWKQVVQYDGWPNGLKIHIDGRIFIADYKKGILILDPVSGKLETCLGHLHSEGFKGVNDLIFDRRGQLYFTDQGQTGMHDPTGRVFRYNFDNQRLDCLISTGVSPNGLVLNPEENVLYVGMTRGNAVWRIPLLPDGSTSKVGIFTQLAGGVSGADGLAIDEEGKVFVCDAGNGCVWVFNKFAEPIYRLRSCTQGRTTTNLAFGNEDRRQLYITDSSTGTILRIKMEVSGMKLYSHI
jgi:gluconolactonase